MLVAVAHPDDESWIFGAAIAALVSLGATVELYCATDGEAAARLTRHAAGTPEALARLRSAELETAARRLGLARVHQGHLPDLALDAHMERLEQDIAQLAARMKPVCVLTHDRNGDYGHPDHAAVARAARSACDRTLGPSGWIAEPLWPDGLFVALREHLKRARLPLLTRQHPPPKNSFPPLHLPPGPWHAQQRHALSAHATQLRGVSPEDFLQPGLCRRWREAVCFRWIAP